MKIMEIWIWVCGIDEDGTWHGQSLITKTQTQALFGDLCGMDSDTYTHSHVGDFMLGSRLDVVKL